MAKDKQKKNTGRFTPAKYDWEKLSDKEKENIKKFGNPHKLGFLRFIMIMMGTQFFYAITMAFLVTKEVVIIDVAFFNNVLDAILYTIIFVMIWQRKKATRPLAIATLSLDCVLTIVDFFVRAGFQPNGQEIYSLTTTLLFNGLLIIYFVVSRRVKYTCTRPLYDPEEEKVSIKNHYFKPSTWPFWRDLIIMFFIFSVVGHWLEFGYCTLIKFGILPGTVDPTNQIWSDFLFPFPIYGGGAVACALIFYPIKMGLEKLIKNKALTLVAVFIVSGIVCSAMELAMGLVTNQDLKLWDYTNMFCNFMGQVCLQNSFFFAVAATIMTYVVYPLLKDGFARIEKYMNWVFIAVLVFGVLLFAFYYFNYLPEQISKVDPKIYSEKMSVSQY